MATASLTNYKQQHGEKGCNRTGTYKSNFFNAIHTVKFFEKHKQGPKHSTETSKSQSSRHNTYSGPLPTEAAALNSFRFIGLCSFQAITFCSGKARAYLLTALRVLWSIRLAQHHASECPSDGPAASEPPVSVDELIRVFLGYSPWDMEGEAPPILFL